MLDPGGGGGGTAAGTSIGAPVGKAVGGLVKMAAPAIAGAPAPTEGGGFVFSVEQLDEVIRQWEDLRESLKTDELDAERMAHVEPPGREFASGDFAKYANPSGKAFLEANKRMQKYVAEYINALQNAKQRISTQEEQSQSDVARAGEQPA